ncbi:MAG: flagellar type III secretion system pore protein FliP [Dysosmobacter sp.]
MDSSWINVNGENVQTLQILLMTTLVTLLPSMVVMMTSFTRYIISFSFLRSAMGLQQNPPNMVLVGMALFLTLFTMSPVISQIQTTAYEPYVAEEITQEEFLDRAEVPLKEFMLRNTSRARLESVLRPGGVAAFRRTRTAPWRCPCGSWCPPL